ncbi:hypothetical protein, partial [Lactiplantibacillus pentosus]|uniref:hypothetical protein n=1 Tax=Lactiplantibacillus pentosus TaxID=1589 RepID=UPI0021A59FF6
SAHQNKTGRQVPGKIPGTYRPESSLIKLSNFKGSLYLHDSMKGLLIIWGKALFSFEMKTVIL